MTRFFLYRSPIDPSIDISESYVHIIYNNKLLNKKNRFQYYRVQYYISKDELNKGQREREREIEIKQSIVSTKISHWFNKKCGEGEKERNVYAKCIAATRYV